MASVLDFELKPEPEPSDITLIPEMRLCVAMTLQALKDLRSPDPVRCLDALAWWIEDGPAWVNMLLDDSMDEAEVLRFVLTIGGRNGRRISLTR